MNFAFGIVQKAKRIDRQDVSAQNERVKKMNNKGSNGWGHHHSPS